MHSTSLLVAARQLGRSRELIAQLVWREVVGRYRGSFAGLLWSLLNPLLTLAMYTFVFGVVFRTRWGLPGESTFDFALVLFAGLTLHSLLAECINRAPGLILGNLGYVKQVVFPIEILPMVALGSALFHAAVSFLLLIAVWAITHGGIPAAALSIPLVVLPLCLIGLGLGWWLAAAAVYFRDIGQIVGFVSALLLFFSPIFYPAGSVPEPFRSLMKYSPLTFVVESTREALVRGSVPASSDWLAYSAVSLAVAWAGFAWFQKSRSGFADVL